MRPDFKKLLKKHQTHTTLFDEMAMIDALNESYEIGKKHSDGEFKQLKEAFDSLLYEYAHTCRLKKATNLVIEDWEKRAGTY